MRRTLLVVGVFLAAGAAALPAVAVRAVGEQSPRVFPGGRYFVVACGFSHRNNDDPIVFAGQPGKSHNHTFVGNADVDADTTPEVLVGGPTSCGDAGDSSAYWVPTLFVGGRPLRPLLAVSYYVRRTYEAVRPIPAGLKMIAGNAAARKRQSLGVVGWACGGIGATPRSAVVPVCGEDESLAFRVTFPNCWNGRDLDSADHKRHLAYSVGGSCPRTHPVALPTVMLILLYPSTELGRPIQSSGRYGAHGDFMNGWEPEMQAKLVQALN